MCCENDQMFEHHGGGRGLHGSQGAHHKGMMHGCCCGGRKFLSKKEKIEMLEEYRESLKNELEGVEEELKKLKEM